MSKHTPGPWQFAHRKNADDMYRTQVFDCDGGEIATIAWYPIHHRNGIISTARESNARLIAAAPEMLEALRMARDEFRHLGYRALAADVVADAISKAEGR